MLVGGRLLVLAQPVARDAPADVLIADLTAEKIRAAAAAEGFKRIAAQHRAFDVPEDVAIMLALVMMRIHIDDQKILIIARARLLGGVLEMLAGIVGVEPQAADFVVDCVHGCSPLTRRDKDRRRARRFHTF